MSTLRWAHRIRATALTMIDAKRLLKAVKRNPGAFDAPLMPNACRDRPALAQVGDR